MNNKKDLPGLSPPNALSLSPGSGPAAVAAWSVDQFESAAAQAFLGPSIWDKPNPYDSMAPVGGGPHDFKLEYMDLDEFLSENGLGGQSSSGGHGHGHHPSGVGSAGGVASPHESSCSSPPQTHLPGHGGSEENKVSSTTGSKERDESSNGNAVNFDPRRRRFSEEELKPQPMVKKSKKQFVPDELKDEKYWARRRKNNLAAKRSRDARRVKENQIAIRAAYLEKENAKLREQLDKLTRENMMLRDKLTAVAKAEQKIVGQ